MSDRFDTTDLLNCYRRGVFPMADSREDMRIFLMDPDVRGVLPRDRFHVPKRLQRTVRQGPFRVTIDTAFNRVIEACAEPHPTRPATWINDAILNLYGALHRQGYAHSVECWNDENELVGGLYGVSLGAAFFGESMFSRATDASKIALVHLVARLITGGYELLDAQFHNPHLEQFGLEELSRNAFRTQLWQALRHEANFYSLGARGSSSDGSTALQAITQIS
ncbi:MAG: leucyl/phenylalanyl-tRNA--protein transferase [Henriciella sp.]|nr:leucyl/phenylalanyl-tRNA--protein transferase [Henriciella sp.]